MTMCAACCVRGPRWSTGRIFVRGSMANQSQTTCVEQRNLVRSSSNWRCGSQRLREERSCKVCAYTGCASQPGGDGVLPVAEDALCSGRIQPFGERRQHHRDLERSLFLIIITGTTLVPAGIKAALSVVFLLRTCPRFFSLELELPHRALSQSFEDT